MIEYGPLADWKTVAGGGQEMQDVFWYIKEAIDAYFGGRPFQVTVKAGLVIGRKPERRPEPRIEGQIEGQIEGEIEGQIEGRGVAPDGFAVDSITAPMPLTYNPDDSFDHIDTGLPWPPQDIAEGSVRVGEHADPAIQELASVDYALDEDSQELDAFGGGKRRPRHPVD